MSTKHGQPGLSSDQRSTIRSTILSTRHTLEDELRRQLEKYGIYEDKRLPLENLMHLSVEEIHTRRTLDAAIERELESTEGDLKRSITNYVREATKTYLNRFVALKTIEVRGLVEETITERPEYGNRSYMHHTVAEIAGELTNAPDDGFGAALDLAYQEIGAEIRMIFEESEHTAIDLDAQVREEVLDELDAIDDQAWESDEALGWVYQYFGEEEREEIDERVDKENYKIAGTDIATKTQLFTPRHIVEWMVDNSLGRIWLEMQDGRTNIDSKDMCFYLSPNEGSLTTRKSKPAEEITVLDPACGSGHMLLYSFDVLYQMYLEDGSIPEQYIPREILRNNLYGIDIDSGAAQIAALSLYLKAKEYSPDVEIPQLNIISADAVLVNGDRKREILDRAQSELEEEILEQVWRSFANIREVGSLVEIEEQIDSVISDHRERFEETGQAQFTNDGKLTSQSTFVVGGEVESWDQIKERLLENAHQLAQEALEQDDPIEEMFASEVGKTIEILDLISGTYDVVVSNPPYLASSKMGDELNQYVKDHYIGKRDLYSAFIQRCRNFVQETGYVSMITMETFMFLSSYEQFREWFLSNSGITEMAHFEHRDEGYMNTAFCFTGRTIDQARFISLVESDNKVDRLRETYSGLADGRDLDNVYLTSPELFNEIRRSPFAYWFGDEVLNLFSEYPPLDQLSDISGGVASGDNDHHLRKYWEVDFDDLGEKYQWHVRGGDRNPYYDIIDYTIRWENDGQNITEYGDKHGKNYQGLSDTSKYFQEGIAFRSFSNEFMAKYYPGDCVYDKSVYSIHPDELSLYYILGYVNSNLFRYLANGINPTVNFNPSDAGEIPVPTSEETETTISNYVQENIEAQQSNFSYTEVARSFDIDKYSEINNIREWVRTALFEKDISEATIVENHSKIDKEIYSMISVSEELVSELNRSYQTDFASIETDPEEVRSEIKSMIENGKSLEDIYTRLGLSPTDLAHFRKGNNLYRDKEKEAVCKRFISVILGVLFGRWMPEAPIQRDEIIDVTAESDVDNLFRTALDEVVKDPDDTLDYFSGILGESVGQWLSDDYFRYYHCKEYRRRGQRIPIYWQLESPNGSFSCFIYYHNIGSNTLPKLRGQYLDSRIGELENELETLNAQTSGDDPDKELLKRKEEVQNDLDDIREFRDTIDEMIDDGVTVDVEKGIWENLKEWDQYEVLETGLPKLKSSYSR
ncbi:BREX-1 system adenine-specific DNA-methyltransferase PglX [Halorubrum sp. SD626R]|uniref:BREX-1 system adenine-specific DNA-methyltransferase PglX n=1 Tax=Halorubrum sp. SD626R TaxID=1419722 RepID=UPI000B82F1B3|nr:BREX-1 system adenine-specific DNA-methyltransferase PglX [Halorubrum sp. SD626R]TKX79905.1 BREX-1 system adenine-specific DNA-methyltransferase PglX [Halorubrum sp. SD626R]